MSGAVFRRPAGLDTIQEFKVESNVSSAKLARPTTIIHHERTNELHGSAFETARNNAVGKARTPTDFYDKPPQLVRNEFGVSAGGPVYIPNKSTTPSRQTPRPGPGSRPLTRGS